MTTSASTLTTAADPAMDKKTQDKVDRLLRCVESLVPEQVPATLDAACYRWKVSPLNVGHLVPVPRWKPPRLSLLYGLDKEIKALDRNTEAFMQGKPASHALLTGPRGCGKTSIVHGVAHRHARNGLKVVRMSRERLVDLAELVYALGARKEKILVICDELSFADGNDGYIGAKASLDELDGNKSAVLVYATSNRRHLVPENVSENLEAQMDDEGEIHPGETTEEKVSLSDRFGLWIPVFSPDQDEYLKLVAKWFKNHGQDKVDDTTLQSSLQWAMERGSLNGRIARQFVEGHIKGKEKP